MKSLNPACKLIGLVVPTLLLAGLHHPAVNLAVFAVCLAALLLSRANVKVLAGALLPVLLVAVGMFSTGYHFHAGAGMPINAAAQALTGAAVWNGLVLGGRVLAFAGLGLLFVLTTDRILLVRSLQQQLRLPGVRLRPAGRLGHPAQYDGGVQAHPRRLCRPRYPGFSRLPALLKPLLVKSVRWSEELSIAMESRGFDGRVPRTCSQPLRLRPVDVLFPILSCALFLALFFLLGR
ncbi:MAG: energy-coupling factor transporter transmembrane component T family protein [Flavonifractor plautii]